jgi:hypothetical protein
MYSSFKNQHTMIIQKSSCQVLLGIIVLNLISTWLHYTHNAIFLADYPGPAWFTPQMIMVTIAAMSTIGLWGYRLYSQNACKWAYFCLGLYSITSISSPGHYLFPMVAPMSTTMHSLIWLDACSGSALIGFLGWSGLVAQEWRGARSDAAN